MQYNKNIKNRVKILGISAIALVIGASSIFYACKKDTSFGHEQPQVMMDLVEGDNGVTITFKQHGVGSGCDKYCASGGSSCWLWCSAMEFPDIMIDHSLIGTVSFYSTNVEDDDEDNSKNIVLNFKYKYNTAVLLDELFGADRVLTIDEDMVEENGSSLQKLIGTTLPCTIPAGSYIATVNTDGIKVVVPVVY